MPPPVIIEPCRLDLSRVVFDKEHIHRHNPQRHEFDLLDAIVHFDDEARIFAGYHDVRDDAWWVRGHVPGRALFPGALMIETAAQLASFATHELLKDDRFIGFGGVDAVKFRGVVEPPCRFVVIGRARKITRRRMICEVQGFVDQAMVFEAVVTGMPV